MPVRRTIAIETGFHRNTVKKWLDWIAANTAYLTIEQTTGQAGEVQNKRLSHNWANLETDWKAIQDFIGRGKAEAREE